MGANLNNSSRNGRSGNRLSSKRRRPGLMGDINITPFVDVMMVLLVIFMVAAPLMTVGLQIDLPNAKTPAVEGQDEPVIISINAQKKLFLQETELELNVLMAKLSAILEANPNNRVFVQADESLDYGTVMQMMSAISLAGHRKIALVTESPSS